MVILGKENIFNSKAAAILLAAMSYQTYPFFLEGKLILPKGFELRYTIRALANVENPTEEVFGFIAEPKDKIVIAFRGYASYPTDHLTRANSSKRNWICYNYLSIVVYTNYTYYDYLSRIGIAATIPAGSRCRFGGFIRRIV